MNSTLQMNPTPPQAEERPLNCDVWQGDLGDYGHEAVVVKPPSLERENIILEIFRNRSEMEAQLILKDTGEIIDRIPVAWKARENNLDYLSVSKISAYEQCPACFYRQYIAEESKSVDNGNYFTKFGTILHEVVEVAMKTYRDTGIVLNPNNLLMNSWSKYDLQGFGDYEQANKLVTEYFAQNPIDRRPDRPVFIEEEWRGELGGCTFGLIIDYAGIMKSNEEIGLLRDYKTNRMPFTTADLQNSLQLRIYEIILRRFLSPQVKIWKTGYDLFFHGWQGCPDRNEDDLKRAEEYVSITNHQIKNDNTWEERLNAYCGYRECRHTCKTYQNALKREHDFSSPIVKSDVMDLSMLNAERDRMTILEKNAKNRKEECANILKQEIEEAMKRGEKFVINGQELSLYANQTSSYRYSDVRNVLLVNNKLNILDDCLQISKTKFDAKVKADPTLRLQLAGCTNSNYATPYIVSRKV